MASVPRMTTRITRFAFCSKAFNLQLRTFAATHSRWNKDQLTDPPRGNPTVTGRGPPEPPKDEAVKLKDNYAAATYLGTTRRLPEFNLHDRVVLVSGAARGLGLVTAEALCEAGATGMP